MNTFYICRHGQTENNKAERLSGWLDTPLTPKGLENVRTAAHKLKDVNFDVVYSSDLGRAFITASDITKTLSYNGEIHRAFGLRENGYGSIANMLVSEAEAQYPELHKNVDFVPPGGESLGQMQQRVLGFVTELDEAHTGKTILLAAHDGVIKSLYSNFSGINLGIHNADYSYPNDFVASFTVENGRINTFEEVTLT